MQIEGAHIILLIRDFATCKTFKVNELKNDKTLWTDLPINVFDTVNCSKKQISGN